MQNRRKNPVDEIWILAAKKMANDLQKLLALLRESWKGSISRVFEISRQEAKARNEEKQIEDKILIEKSSKLLISDLWREKATRGPASGKSANQRNGARILLTSRPPKLM